MKRYKESSCSRSGESTVYVAILLITIGVLVLSSELGLLPNTLKQVLLTWQMFLITLGVFSLLKRHYINGALLIFIGGYFLLPKLSLIFPGFMGGIVFNAQLFWPALLIVIGFFILIRILFKNRFHNNAHSFKRKREEFMDNEKAETSNNFKESSNYMDGRYVFKDIMFSGGEQIVFSKEFKGGEVNALFGEIKLDLCNVEKLDIENYLEVNVVFGSIILYVPQEWDIQLKSNAIFGDIRDKRHTYDYKSNKEITATLNLKGSCIFGNIEVR